MAGDLGLGPDFAKAVGGGGAAAAGASKAKGSGAGAGGDVGAGVVTMSSPSQVNEVILRGHN
jgi:hypothetical protein